MAPTENVMLKRESGSNVLPKCLFARLSDVWTPRELILPHLRLICFLCCLLKVITSCLEIYKRTAQGEPPPKGVGTEWKMRYTCGRRSETARAGGCRCETLEEKYFYLCQEQPFTLSRSTRRHRKCYSCCEKSRVNVFPRQDYVVVQLPRSPPISSLLSQIFPGVSQPAAAEGGRGGIGSPSPSQPSLLRAVIVKKTNKLPAYLCIMNGGQP